ncbi:hypothetical protein [Kutzneria buriramensis]|uniref:hypothetical protein n=1 Tax=Kutzneria buriramensis TaxID=1045776 RepID=UPI0011C14321|nr:hypothetical protein [Kutzneria buriramensis]
MAVVVAEAPEQPLQFVTDVPPLLCGAVEVAAVGFAQIAAVNKTFGLFKHVFGTSHAEEGAPVSGTDQRATFADLSVAALSQARSDLD